MKTHLLLPVLLSSKYWHKILNTAAANLLYWPLWDAAGRNCTELTGKTASIDLAYNGGFEIAGAGGADVWAYTNEGVGTGAIADETTLVHEGGSEHAAKLTAGSSANTYIQLNSGTVRVTPGISITLSMWTRGDGTNAGRYSVQDQTNSVFIRTAVSTGITGETYTQVDYSFTVPAGCYMLAITLWCPTTDTGIAYFDDVAVTCAAQPATGSYQPTGITYGQASPVAGKTATAHNGVDSAIYIGTGTFASLWNGNVGSAISWGKIDTAGTWTDAALRYTFHVKGRQNQQYYIVLGRTTVNHQLQWARKAGGASGASVTYTFNPTGTANWFYQGMTWDMGSDPKKLRCYFYVPGEVAWTKFYDDTPATGIEDWDTGVSTPDDANTVLAGGSLTAQEWIGLCGPKALWNGVVLTDAQMQRVMTP